MTDIVDICSNALMMIGDNPISDINEPTVRARLASTLYPNVRDATLRAHPWNCAKRRVILSPDVNVPAFGYRSQFSLPGDWLRTLVVGSHFGRDSYTVEGRKILAHGDVIALLYLYRNDDESTWDADLTDAMTIALAARLAYPIAKSATLAQSMEQKLAAVLKTARAVNGQENPPETLGNFPLIENRLIGWGSGDYGFRFDEFDSAN